MAISPTKLASLPTVSQGNQQFMVDNPQYGYNGAANPTSNVPLSSAQTTAINRQTTQTGFSVAGGNISYTPIQTPVNVTVKADQLGSQAGLAGSFPTTTAPNPNVNPNTVTANNIGLNLNPDGSAKVTATTGEKTAQTPPQPVKTNEELAREFIQNQIAPPSAEDALIKARNEAQLVQRQNERNTIQNALNAETTRMNLDLQSLRGVGAREGVTEAVYGQQSEEVTREAMVRILPLQAQLAMANDNVQQAQSLTDQLFKVYSTDAQNRVDFYNNQKKLIYEAATKDQQKKLDEISKQRDFEISILKDQISSINDAVQQAYKDGNYTLAKELTSAVNGLNTNVFSSSFKQDNQRVFNNVNSVLQKSGVVTNSTAQNNTLLSAIYNVNAGSAEGQQKRDNARMQQLIASGDEKGVKALVMSRVISKMSSGERDAQLDRRNTIDALEEMKSALNDYVAKTGNTNLVKGGIENIANKIGATSDPALASIKTRIVQATQKYRNAITGAAWGEQETAEYKAIFPSISNTSKLNNTIIDSMIGALKGNEKNAVSLFLGGEDIYDGIFGNNKSQTSQVQTVRPEVLNIFDNLIGSNNQTQNTRSKSFSDMPGILSKELGNFF